MTRGRWWVRLARFGIPYRRRITATSGLLLVSAVLLAASPWPTKLATDYVLAGKPLPSGLRWIADLPGLGTPTAQLVVLGVLTIAVFVARAVVMAVVQVERQTLGERMTFDVAADALEKLQRRSHVQLTTAPTGDTVQRVTTDSRCVNLLLLVLLGFVSAASTFVVMLVVSAGIDGSLAVVLVVAAVPMLIAAQRMMRPMAMASLQQANDDGAVMATAEQALTAVPDVQSFTAEEYETARLDRAVAARVRSTIRVQWFNLGYEMLIGLFTAGATAYILGAGGLQAISGTTTIGDIIVLSTYVALLFGPIITIAMLGQGIAFARAGGTRVLEILDAPEDVRESRHPVSLPTRRGAARVALDRVTFGYEANRPVLTDVTLTAEPGETIALVGRTGAGKSTLVSLVPRFFDPWTGTVTIDGIDIRDARIHDVRQRVSVVSQHPLVLAASVAENVAYGDPHASRREIERAAEAALAAEFIDALPDGYDTVIGEWGTTLSGGQRQRLAIARAFLKNAPILILDEPTSALDAESETLLVQAVERLRADRTVLVIAHRLSTIRRADRIVVLDHGRITEQGSHHELLTHQGDYANLHNLQVRDDTYAVALLQPERGA